MKFKKKSKNYFINTDAGDVEKSVEVFNNLTTTIGEGVDKLNYTIDVNRIYDILNEHKELMRNLE